MNRIIRILTAPGLLWLPLPGLAQNTNTLPQLAGKDQTGTGPVRGGTSESGAPTRVVTTGESDVVFVGDASPPGNSVALWCRRPAQRWAEAVPIGNGRLGGMVWGGVREERIDLNEDTLWSGEPYNNINTNGLKSLPVIRALLLAGKNSEAQALVEQNMNGKYNECYPPMGWLRIRFPISGQVRDYSRRLDLNGAIAHVEFSHEGVLYSRDVFASFPDQRLVVRLETDRPGKLSFRAS